MASVVSAEAEVKYRFTNRWSVVGFGGHGWASMRSDELDGGSEVGSGGFGFRYMIARMFGLGAGIDFAWSRDDFAWYLMFGGSWR